MASNDFIGKKILVTGIQGSGKTYYTKWFIKKYFKKTITYRVTSDFDKENVYLYRPAENQVLGEFKEFGKHVRNLAKDGKISCCVVDEADLFFHNNFEISEEWNDLILMHRHYGLTIIFITRRPQDVPTRMVESCHHIFIFKLEGANAKKKFQAIDPRIVDLMEKLDYDRHNFIWKQLGEVPKIHEAV